MTVQFKGCIAMQIEIPFDKRILKKDYNFILSFLFQLTTVALLSKLCGNCNNRLCKMLRK